MNMAGLDALVDGKHVSLSVTIQVNMILRLRVIEQKTQYGMKENER